MKKLILIIACVCALVCMCSCQQTITRHYGGDETIELPKGMMLMEVTWDGDNNRWELLAPMPENYVPATKVFKQSSNWHVFEGTVTYIESR